MKSVKGGYEFVLVDAETRARTPAFDPQKLAAALWLATGQKAVYDLEVDTSLLSPRECALRIVSHVQSGSPADAFDQIRRRRGAQES